MREAFDSYFHPDDKFFADLWSQAWVVPDANILLAFYRLTANTRNQLSTTLHSFGDRLWIPHQVGLEFSRNRPHVIRAQRRVYKDLRESLELLRTQAIKQIRDALPPKAHPFLDADDLTPRLHASVQETLDVIAAADSDHPDLLANDTILQDVLALFEGKVGPPYPDGRLREIGKSGDDRFARQIPPGFKDATGPNKKDGDRQYGDLIIWFQIIDFSKAAPGRSVIFVTEDSKADWWWRPNDQTIGPRPELRDEFRAETGGRFYMYSLERFLRWAKEKLPEAVTDAAIEEVRQVEAERPAFRTHMADRVIGETICQAILGGGNLARAIEYQQQLVKAEAQAFRLRLQQEDPLRWKSVLTNLGYPTDTLAYLRRIERDRLLALKAHADLASFGGLADYLGMAPDRPSPEEDEPTASTPESSADAPSDRGSPTDADTAGDDAEP